MKKILFLTWALLAMTGAGAANRQLSEKSTTMSKLANDTRVFAIDPAIDVQGVRFKNRFGIELAAHLYLPKDFDSSKKYAAIAVSGPFGAVKEQSSGLYAQEMARRGFVAMAFDPSFTGESSGEPRYVASPDINTEDFRRLSISSRCSILSMPGASASSVSAAGEDWR